MPMLIPVVVGYAVTAAVTYAVIGGVVASVIGSLVSYAVSSMMSSGSKQGPSELQSGQARGALINTASNVEPIPVVYGTCRKGGARVLTSLYDAGNSVLVSVIVMGEGEISGYDKVYFDDEEVYPGPWRYSTYGSVERMVGTDDQAYLPSITAKVAAWTSNHRLRGVAYIASFHTFAPSIYRGLPTITADVRGKLVYDPRIVGSPNSPAYSNNPALCIRDYLTNSRYGRGVPSSAIDDASFIVAANHCDELVTVPAPGSPDGFTTTTQKRYTCDGTLNPDDGTLENIRALLTSCRGMLIYSSGKYRIVIDKAETPSSFAFTEDNIVGEWQIRLPGKRDKVNRVKARFVNPDRSWQPDMVIVDSPAFRTADNEILLEREIDLPYTKNTYTAQQIAGIELKQSRINIVCQFTAMCEGLRCEVGDVVPITHSTPGWNAKPFRIMEMIVMPNDEVKVTAMAYDDEIYDLDDLTLADVAPNTNLPDPFAGLTITGLTASSGTADLLLQGDGTVVPRIRLRWGALENAFISRFELQFARADISPTEWGDAIIVAVGDSLVLPVEGFIMPVTDGVSYHVRVRAVTKIGNTGDYATVFSHTVVGKTADPSDVTGFSAQQHGDNVNFRWNQISDVDLAGYEIRYNDEGVSDWDSAAVITSVTRGTAITNGFVPPGTWELLIKARDTSGNYSANADTATLTVENERTVVSDTEESPLWLGEKSNLVRHWTGVLVPDSTSTAASLGADLFDECVPDPYPTCTYTAPEIDIGFDAYVRVWSDIVSSVAPGSTEPDDPVMQVDYRTAAGSYDGPENWTIGMVTGRHFRNGFTFTTANGILIFTGFSLVIDQSEGSRRAENVAVSAGGTDITFSPQFHSTPNLQVTAQGAGSPTEARFTYWENLATTGARIHVTNPAGSSVGGVASWQATGV